MTISARTDEIATSTQRRPDRKERNIRGEFKVYGWKCYRASRRTGDKIVTQVTDLNTFLLLFFHIALPLPPAMQYWMVKQEPTAYSWDQFVRDGRACWTGV